MGRKVLPSTMSSHDASKLEVVQREALERDQEVDDWFDERFESMIDHNVEEETPMINEEPDGWELGHEDEVNEDDPLDDMMNIEDML